MEITTIGLDLAKNVFQIHGVNAAGDTVVRKVLRRTPVSYTHLTLPTIYSV